MTVTGEDADEDISELVDLITHEPKFDGFLGAKKSVHDEDLVSYRQTGERREKGFEQAGFRRLAIARA